MDFLSPRPSDRRRKEVSLSSAVALSPEAIFIENEAATGSRRTIQQKTLATLRKAPDFSEEDLQILLWTLNHDTVCCMAREMRVSPDYIKSRQKAIRKKLSENLCVIRAIFESGGETN